MTSGGRVTSPAARNEKAHAPTRENRGFLARNQCGQPGPARQENISYDVPYRCDAPLKIS